MAIRDDQPDLHILHSQLIGDLVTHQPSGCSCVTVGTLIELDPRHLIMCMTSVRPARQVRIKQREITRQLRMQMSSSKRQNREQTKQTEIASIEVWF